MAPDKSNLKSERVKFHNKIKALFECHNGKKVDFVPEGSLQTLFNKPEGGLKEHLKIVLPETSDTTIQELVSFIRDKAPKTFATLVSSGISECIKSFSDNNIHDGLLPLFEDDDDSDDTIRFLAEAQREALPKLLENEVFGIQSAKADRRNMEGDLRDPVVAIQRLGEANQDVRENAERAAVVSAFKAATESCISGAVTSFCDTNQWKSTAPVFTAAKFNYNFHNKVRMPFLLSSDATEASKRIGPFSTVTKQQVHRSHLPSSNKPEKDRDHPWVAVKQLTINQFNGRKQFEEAADLEAGVLKVMKELKHPHLIQTIAHYCKGPDRCFIFPWADYGNLNDYWKRTPLSSSNLQQRLEPEYLRWVFEQLRGLAHAIVMLHSRIIRHGDLKPENILCFPASATNGSKTSCVLVIADAGLAKINHQVTELRNGVTFGPRGSTVMYEPPEAELGANEPRSRRYDVWSMGCICLEFLVWIVRGEHGLNEFRDSLGSERKFYQRGPKYQHRVKSAVCQDAVYTCMKELREHPCTHGQDNPLGLLIGIIEKKLLVQSLGNKTQPSTLSTLDTRVSGGRTPPVPDGHRHLGHNSRVDTFQTTELPEGSRVRSDMMLDELDKILAKKDSFRTPARLNGVTATQAPFAHNQSPSRYETGDGPNTIVGDEETASEGPSQNYITESSRNVVVRERSPS